jgi:serine protease DegQ
MRPPATPGSSGGSAEVAIRQVTSPDAPRANALTSYSDAVNRAAPAVVNVYTTKEVRRRGVPEDPLYRYFFGDSRGGADRVASLGSGVIASADGFVLTNNHVVQAADEIAVALSDGRQVEARLVGADPESDLAVLKIEAKDLPVITFGRSDSLKVGDVVLAIGNPFDVGQTVTMGIVSALAARISASTPSRTSSRPTRRSTRATRAARWSTRTVTWSASTRRSSRAPAARSASASPFRRRSSCRSWTS